MGHAEARAPDASDREHMHLGAGNFGHALGELHRGLGDWPPLRGKKNRLAHEGVRRRRGRWHVPRHSQRKNEPNHAQLRSFIASMLESTKAQSTWLKYDRPLGREWARSNWTIVCSGACLPLAYRRS